MHMHVVYETLAALDIKDKKIITVFNKTDLIRDQDSLVSLKDFRADYTVTASVNRAGCAAFDSADDSESE